MRIILLLSIIIFNFLCVFCNNGFVTIWAPKHVNPGRGINITFLSTNVNYRIMVGIELRKAYTPLVLKNGEFITVNVSKSTILYSNANLAVTLYHKVEFHELCTTKELTVLLGPRKFHTFIQTDKPIYKPGDEIKFRILVIDNEMKPFHMNNINVNFIDPLNRTIEAFTDLDSQYLGVFENNFILSKNTILGEWKIQAIVDKKEEFTSEKIFDVQKYVLPFFEVQVAISAENFLLSENLTVSFFAKYPFGEFVTGTAVLVIKNCQNGKEYLSKRFEGMTEAETVTYSIKDDIKVKTESQAKLEAIVIFTEPESGISMNKSKIFVVHKTPKYKVIPHHPQKYASGTSFYVKITVRDYKDKQVMDTDKHVKLIYSYTIGKRRQRLVQKILRITEGAAKLTIQVPKKVIKFSLEISFDNSEIYYRTIERSDATANTINDLEVDHAPKKPKFNDKVTITVRSEFNMDRIFTVVSSYTGNLQSQEVDCNNQKFCEFDITVTEEMMPHSHVTVYYVLNKLSIYQGSTKLETEDFNRNHLRLDLSTNHAKTKDYAQMYFSTSENSKIYLLAFDKRLKFLRDGNDITYDDVVSTMSKYDGGSQVIVNDLSSWNSCTEDELKRVKSLTDPEIDLRTDDSDYSDEENEIAMSEPEAPDERILRQNFPETWIFESFEVGNKQSAMKEFTVPDSVTTWVISAFSLNPNYGLAMAPAQELTVMNEFFVKLNLPYSIKFKEVLRVDILVYNYVETKKMLDVEVNLENFKRNEFEFVEYSKVRGVCTASYNNEFSSSKSTQIPHTGVKKVSFYIRSNIAEGQKSVMVPKNVTLQVRVKGRSNDGEIYEDLVRKELLIEPVGVKNFMIFNEEYMLNGTATNKNTFRANFTETLASLHVIVGGDYLGNAIDMTTRFKLYPYHCLEQQTSRLKGNVEYFRYLLTKGRKQSKKHFSSYYQSLLYERTKSWSYSSSTGHRAYFLEAMVSATEIGALPKNDKIIIDELNAIKSHQNTNGSFKSFGKFPSVDKSANSDSAAYFETAFVLIPFLKLKNTHVGKKYEDVVTKAFKFLDAVEKNDQAKNEGIGVAAYAYALDGSNTKAMNLLRKLELDSASYLRDKKCYKIRTSDTKCDMRLTSYTALAYLAINHPSTAIKIVNWLLKDLNLKFLYSNTHEYAIATEPIAKLAKYLKTDKTDFTVILKNEFDFLTSARITMKNSSKMEYVEFPQHTQSVTSFAEGYGYCTVTTLFENLIILPEVSTLFTVRAVYLSKTKFASIFQVCAEYNSEEDLHLFNVVYEVEMPSGYIYSNVEDLRQNEIKTVEKRKKGALVYIYYNDFESGKGYCVEIKAKKLFEVLDIKPAGVKVYDYNDKTNVAIEFYSPVNPEC